MSEKSAKIVGSKPARRPPAPVTPGVAEAVVQAALLAVGEHGVGFRGFLERFFGLVIAGIAVGMILQRELAVRALDLLIRGLRARPRAPRSSRASSRCSPFGHLYHRRPQQPVAQHVSAPELFDDFAFAPAFGRLVRDGLMDSADRSRRRAPRSGARRACAGCRRAARWISSTPRRYASAASPAGLRLERALEVVHRAAAAPRRCSAAAASASVWRSRSMRLR